MELKEQRSQQRDQKLTVQLDRSLMEALRNRQAQLSRELGVSISLSQAAGSAIRRGLEQYQETKE